jgi:hypothetical protein
MSPNVFWCEDRTAAVIDPTTLPSSGRDGKRGNDDPRDQEVITYAFTEDKEIKRLLVRKSLLVF